MSSFYYDFARGLTVVATLCLCIVMGVFTVSTVRVIIRVYRKRNEELTAKDLHEDIYQPELAHGLAAMLYHLDLRKAGLAAENPTHNLPTFNRIEPDQQAVYVNDARTVLRYVISRAVQANVPIDGPARFVLLDVIRPMAEIGAFARNMDVPDTHVVASVGDGASRRTILLGQCRTAFSVVNGYETELASQQEATRPSARHSS